MASAARSQASRADTPLETQPSPVSTAVSYGLATQDDAQPVADLYLRSFPHLARKWFRSEAHARVFYTDLFELMRLAHGDSFFVARDARRVVGFLILTIPGVRLFSQLTRERLLWRTIRHAVGGRYGFSAAFVGRGLSRLRGAAVEEPEQLFARDPHVYVVAVEADLTGRGIGAALLRLARQFCASRFDRIWLTVERDNLGAIRFYERMGFCTTRTSAAEHYMIWDLRQ